MKRAPVLSLLLITLLAAVLLWYGLNKPDRALELSQAKEELQQQKSAVFFYASSSTPIVKNVTERISENINTQFALVASAYAEEIQYPSYSQPLRATDTQLLQPNVYHPQAVPLEKGASASIQLDRYRFTYPEAVNARLILKGISADSAGVSLFSELDGKLLVSSNAKKNDQGFVVELKAETGWDGPVRIEFEIKVGGQMQIVQTGFEYSQPVATITGVGAASTEGTDWIIPVTLKVDSAGHYRLRANLFGANLVGASRKPLAILSISHSLTEGKAELKLRVFNTLLKGQVGPLWLSHFQLERRSAMPGEPTRYGTSVAEGFVVEYLGDSQGSDQDSDEAYQPTPEEQERLKFLQNMAEKK
jgi:hypothetical protein